MSEKITHSENGETLTLLQKISFPVYKLGREKPEIENGRAFYYYRKSVEEGVNEYSYQVLDDKNVKGDTLALRRLGMKAKDITLRKLSKAIFFIGDMIKIADGITWFIDSSGFIFQYKKHKLAKLKFYRIKKLIPISSGGCLVEIYNELARYKSLYYPTPDKAYVGILEFDGMRLLYGFYQTEMRSSIRKV